MTVVIGIDPGQTTGVAVMNYTATRFELLEAHQWDDPDTVWERILELIVKYQELIPDTVDLVVLCESFELRPDVISPDETPKYIIKDLDRYVAPHQEVIYQMASQAKTGCPPAKGGMRDRLHAFGLYQRAKRHANDAIRHTVIYAIHTLRNRPLIEKGWGPPPSK